MAATGSKRAAIAAGTIPDTNPIMVDTPKPNTMFLSVSTTSKLPIGIKVINQTKIKPPKPPIKLKKIASNKN